MELHVLEGGESGGRVVTLYQNVLSLPHSVVMFDAFGQHSPGWSPTGLDGVNVLDTLGQLSS